MHRLRGTVRRAEPGEGPVLLRIVVGSDDAKVGRVDRIVAFDLEREDAPGERVRIEPSAKVRLEPMSEERCRWDAVEDDPELAPLRKRAPGPHVTVTVERVAIREGERVVVAGEPIEHSFDEKTAGPRAAPVRRLVRLRAIAIAAGDDADALVDRALRGKKAKKPVEARARAPWINARRVLAALGVLFACAAFAIPRSPVGLDLAAWSASLLATAFGLATASRMPRFVHGGAAVARLLESHGKVVALLAVGVLTFVFFPTFGDASSYGDTRRPPINGSLLSVGLVSAQIAAVLVIVAVGTGRVARLLRVLLHAPAWGPRDLEDVWGSTEGVVRDPTPVKVDGEARAIANVIEREVRSGSDPDIVVEKVLNRGTFFVESDDGSFELDPARATWASTVRIVEPEEKRKNPDKSKVTDVVPIGGTVLVAGRATRQWKGRPARLADGGPESLVFLATPAGTSPRSRARRFLAIRLVGLFAIAACLVALIVTASLVEPQLPAFHIEGD